MTLTALEISYQAEQWQAFENGAADQWQAELITTSGTTTLPDLTFVSTGAIDQNGSERRTIIPNLNIAPNEEFQLRFRAIPGSSEGTASNGAFINEFHYDNTSTDEGEFIEIVLGSDYPDDLSQMSVVLYNGTNGVDYGTHPLSGFQTGNITTSGHRFFYRDIAGIQNGAPDGIALIDGTTVLDFISYEGDFAATSGPAQGETSTDVGVSQGASTPVGQRSLGLIGTGADSSDFSWSVIDAAFSKGMPNPGQTFEGVSLAPQGIAIDQLRITALLDLNADGTPDGDDDTDGDGQSNLLEFLAGTNPLDPNSTFLPKLDADPITLSFPTLTGRTYLIEESDDLVTWTPGTSIAGDGTLQAVLLSNGTRKFFRIRISRSS